METHEKIKEAVRKGKRNYYGTPEECKKERKNKSTTRDKWFVSRKNDNVKYSSVMFIEATPDSELVNTLKKIEEKHKISTDKRIKFIEKGGMKLIDAVRPSNQFRKNCQESQCIVCKDNEKFANCRKANVGYTIFCKNCKSKGITRVYEGESCRNLFQRQREHVDELS